MDICSLRAVMNMLLGPSVETGYLMEGAHFRVLASFQRSNTCDDVDSAEMVVISGDEAARLQRHLDLTHMVQVPYKPKHCLV
ncbi:hypothetical protein EVAR_83173_1 [Eumeta japonica]|uniref:Uncharacterized protein n=1 Tax=Eumeta variegata TaxID=151549 RepID=A0A4C1YBE5_EUMVA|nr:hypothetical protein EVAR_83173_1 [Eumeta japonica]